MLKIIHDENGAFRPIQIRTISQPVVRPMCAQEVKTAIPVSCIQAPLPQSMDYIQASPPGSEPDGRLIADTPLKRLLGQAAASGHLDQVLSQPDQTPDLVLDDTPRELTAHNSSVFPCNSFENFYSRNGSMIFPPGSRPGSMLFNPFGSNQSMELKESVLPAFDDMFIKYMGDNGDGDIDKDAPSM